jgi:membrane-bound lytic murein transglycosylase A
LDSDRNLGRSRLTPRRHVLILAMSLILGGCATHPAVAPSGLQLTRTSFAALPGWASGNREAARAAFQSGCAALAAKPPQTPMAYAGTTGDWAPVCAVSADAGGDFFESQFTPYAIEGQALFTGYYEPEISGSRSRHDAFQTPVYGLPADLISVDLDRFLPNQKGEHIAGKLSGQILVPYPDRAEIDQKGLAAAKILFWSDDPVAVFFLQIQGSGRVRFDDGSEARVAFAGVNGRPYTAIGRALIEKGALTRENVSLATIRDWLHQNPQLAQGVMELDRSFVFFQIAPLGNAALGSPGSQGVPLTPLASLAVDARLHPLGAPFYVAANGPNPVSGLMIAQDTGGAIRGAARADIFFGFGPQAEIRAGSLNASGRLYVLLPNAIAAGIGAGKSFAP